MIVKCRNRAHCNDVTRTENGVEIHPGIDPPTHFRVGGEPVVRRSNDEFRVERNPGLIELDPVPVLA